MGVRFDENLSPAQTAILDRWLFWRNVGNIPETQEKRLPIHWEPLIGIAGATATGKSKLEGREPRVPLKVPFEAMYSFAYQNVQSSTESSATCCCNRPNGLSQCL